MKLSKILATSTIIGLTCTAALAENSINFSQSGGTDSINIVKFTQSGDLGNSIGVDTETGPEGDKVTVTGIATVTGSLDTLSIEQIGGGNTANFAITTDTTPASVGSVQIQTTGNGNTSDLTVNQSGVQTLEFAVAVKGNGNSVTADIDGVSSVVNLESDGHGVAYTLSQTGAVDDTDYSHTITANVSKTGDTAANVNLTQSGATNTITLGSTSDEFGTFDGSGTFGLTLLGEAEVNIVQSATVASYVATQTVSPGGSLTVVQSD
jgi:hypothetical protein